MAGVVYSSKLVNAVLPAANATLYTGPAGFVTVVKTMTMGWATTGTVDGVSSVLTGIANGFIWVVPFKGTERASAQWNGMWVIAPGDLIRGSTPATGTVFLMVAGYLLTLP